jgi:hypothetical protein
MQLLIRWLEEVEVEEKEGKVVSNSNNQRKVRVMDKSQQNFLTKHQERFKLRRIRV